MLQDYSDLLLMNVNIQNRLNFSFSQFSKNTDWMKSPFCSFCRIFAVFPSVSKGAPILQYNLWFFTSSAVNC